jgi:hypothetical protein
VTARVAVFSSLEVVLELSSGLGRPRGHDSQRRTRELLERLAEGVSLADAAREARVKPDRVLRLMADPQFRSAVCVLLERQAA